MQLDYWLGKWGRGDTKFHMPAFHPALVKHFPAQAPGAVFVPLCGKSRDMLWLMEQGWDVTGIEASALACRAFFAENGIPCREEKRGAFTVFTGGRAMIWCGDFFALDKKDMPAFSAVYDRAALVALPEDMRAHYAAQVCALLPGTGVRYLLIALEYPQDAAEGPPFSVDEAEVRRLFGGAFKVTLIKRRDDPVLPVLSPKFEGVRVQETVYTLENG